MKHIIISIILFFGFANANAQSKLIVTMILQIAANQAHIAEIEQGFKIAKEGLDFIGNAKKGEFDLHRLFFSSLKQINPTIKNWVKVADIITMQIQIVNNYKNHLKLISNMNQFSASEITHISNVFTKLLNNTTAGIEELTTIVSENNYQMSDDERIKRIDGLYKSMQSDYDFEQSFGTQTLVLGMERQQEFKEAEISKKLNGLP